MKKIYVVLAHRLLWLLWLFSFGYYIALELAVMQRQGFFDPHADSIWIAIFPMMGFFLLIGLFVSAIFIVRIILLLVMKENIRVHIMSVFSWEKHSTRHNIIKVCIILFWCLSFFAEIYYLLFVPDYFLSWEVTMSAFIHSSLFLILMIVLMIDSLARQGKPENKWKGWSKEYKVIF